MDEAHERARRRLRRRRRKRYREFLRSQQEKMMLLFFLDPMPPTFGMLEQTVASTTRVLRKPYQARTFIWTLDTWSTTKFKRRMRMSKPSFRQLLAGFIESPSFAAAGGNRSRRITSEVWLAATIRDLAAGTTLDDICEALGIDESSYSEKREQLMQAVADACITSGQRPLGLPTSQDGWHALADTFSRPEYPEFDTDAMRTCLAGDGTLIGFSPYEAVDYYAKEKWRCRKGFLATNCVFYFDGYRRSVNKLPCNEVYSRLLVELFMLTSCTKAVAQTRC